MPKWKLYNPEGMQDILFERCYQKKNLENSIRSLMRSNGYREIETPVIEFYDVFSNDTQIINQESMFKFVDEKGRILALRPDLTIPTARVVGTKLKEMNLPVKVSYIGNCFQYNDFGLGKQREFTQAGIEIFAMNNPFYDAEVISMAIKTLLLSGVEEFTIELGQVEFFKGLMEEAKFSDDTIETIRKMIEAKDYFGVEELVNESKVNEAIKEQILSLPNYCGDKNTLLELKNKSLNQRSERAVDNLLDILSILEKYDMTQYISVDLGMVKKLNYYTGMIFKGLTYGIGFPILSGGRYDHLCETYGRPLSATGFSLGIDALLTVLQRNETMSDKSSFDTVVMFSEQGRDMGILIAHQLREQGLKVDLIYSEFNLQYAVERNIPGIIYIIDNENIEITNIEDATTVKTTVTQLMGDTK
ncbi:MAG: ATP phosphoribosyltransferase regulatory subunit [Clostridia bacterium]|nr:ATP phosphoribosyltransferase regulatory subunit [Clostridia bacterium]